VASVRTLITSLPGVIPSGVSGPWVSSTPATVNTIGAVMSRRSSRADSVPHANTSPAMIARSATVIVSPPVGCSAMTCSSPSALAGANASMPAIRLGICGSVPALPV